MSVHLGAMGMPMSRYARVAILAALLATAGMMGAGAVPAEAQEWRIYLFGKTEPVVANFYAEEAPWVFYRDDQSMYLFALGCNRIERVERSGAPLPAPACPVEKLPTTMPRVYLQIMDLEAKRLDDSIAKLREQIRAYAAAAVGSDVAAAGQDTSGNRRRIIDRELLLRNQEALVFLQSQINDTLFDIRLSDQRVGKLLEAARSFPRSEKQRFFFFTR